MLEKKIYNTKPYLPPLDSFIEKIKEIYSTAILTNQGPLAQQLEEELEKKLKVPHAILVNNGTTGLMLALQELKIKDKTKTEVILPAFTFIATAHAISALGLKTKFCDINPKTLTLNSEVEKLVDNKTLCVIGVNVYGRPCNFKALEKLGVPVLYDSAHCFGCDVYGKPYGSFGDAEIFSFHATKSFSTFEGGLVTTRNSSLAARLRKSRNFGFSGVDEVDGIGINAKLNEVSAAFGLVSLEGHEERILKNQNISNLYFKKLKDSPRVKFLEKINTLKSNHHYLPILVDPQVRNQLYDYLRENNIMVRRYFYPGCHKMKPYSKRSYNLPNTDKVCNSVLCLPIYPTLSNEVVIQICDHLIGFLNGI